MSIDSNDVQVGVAGAFLDVLCADTIYPFSREAMLEAVTEGVRQAMAAHLDKQEDQA